MKEHYTEADLLETYYMQPGASMPVMMHLARCADCAARYDRLDRKLREAAVCHSEKSEASWAMQRAAVMARVGGRRMIERSWRVAAAAVLAIAIGGGAMLSQREEPAPVPQPVVEAVPADPWQSDELADFGELVEWESWVEGDQKL
jgi:hypothetical protein